MDVTEFNYNLKYADVLGNNVSNPSEVLERIYTRFNVERPSDFYGHSLSVSDVIVLNYNQRHEAYYCDSVGYQKLDNFLLNIKPQNIRIAKLTGEPVSEEMLDILDVKRARMSGWKKSKQLRRLKRLEAVSFMMHLQLREQIGMQSQSTYWMKSYNMDPTRLTRTERADTMDMSSKVIALILS